MNTNIEVLREDEAKETDLWRCTVCGRVGTVGRCCGEETRERANMEQLLADRRPRHPAPGADDVSPVVIGNATLYLGDCLEVMRDMLPGARLRPAR